MKRACIRHCGIYGWCVAQEGVCVGRGSAELEFVGIDGGTAWWLFEQVELMLPAEPQLYDEG